MATKKSITDLNKASLALGKAWGLVEVLDAVTSERTDKFDVEGVLRAVLHLVCEAQGSIVEDGGDLYLMIGEARAVCELLTVDAQDANHDPESASQWALSALPEVLDRVRAAVDSAQAKPLPVAA